MFQRSPLLNYRIEDESESTSDDTERFFNLESGLWEYDKGIPLISIYIEQSTNHKLGRTTATATKESIDQSEGVFSQFDGTQITKTQESIDQSETSLCFYGGTEITETRESIDQTENS